MSYLFSSGGVTAYIGDDGEDVETVDMTLIHPLLHSSMELALSVMIHTPSFLCLVCVYARRKECRFLCYPSHWTTR